MEADRLWKRLNSPSPHHPITPFPVPGGHVVKSKRRYITAICREGGYYVLVLAFVFGVAMLKEMNLLVLMAGMLLGPLVVSWHLVGVTIRGLEVRRKMVDRVTAGDSLVVSVELTNSRRRIGSWGVTVADVVRREGDPPNRAIRPSVWFPYIAAGQSLSNVYRVWFPRRGRYRVGPVTVATRFPFGLAESSFTVPAEENLVVYPRLGRLTRFWNRRQEAVEAPRRRERRHGRTTGEFFGTREWRRGDSRRWIHWRSSARHGTLVVRQFEEHRNRDLAVLVDLWQPERPVPGDLANVELAVSFAATLIHTVCRQETSELLLGIAGSQTACIQGLASASLRHEVMERLAVAEASHADQLAALLEETLDRIAAGTEIILVTTRQVNLAEPARLAPLWRTATRRALLRQVRKVNVAEKSLSDYFQVEF